MSWYWKGAWNANRTAGGGKGSGKKKKKGKDGKEGKQDGGKAEALFPSYDAMPLAGSASSSSSTQSSTQDNKLKQIVKALVETNAVKLPEEVRHLLEEDEGEQFRNDMRQKQNVLNRRRKAHAKVQRIRDAIQQKEDQFAAFQDKLKEQLQEQQEKFEQDIQSLQKNLKEAEEALQDVMGEGQEEEPEQPAAPMKVDLELANLLDSKDYGKKLEVLEDQLKTSKQENQITKQMFNNQAQQLQMYMDRLETMQNSLLAMQGAGAGAALGVDALLPAKAEVTATSPQMAKTPLIPKRKIDPLEGQLPQPPSAEKKQRHGTTQETRSSPSAAVHFVEDSPPKSANPGFFSVQDGMD